MIRAGFHILFFVQSSPQIFFSNHFPGQKPLLLQIYSVLLNNCFFCTIFCLIYSPFICFLSLWILILQFVLSECFPIVLFKGDVSFSLLEYSVIPLPFSQCWTPTIFWRFSHYPKTYKNKQPQKHTPDMHSTEIFLWRVFYTDWAHTAFSFFWHSFRCADSCLYRICL